MANEPHVADVMHQKLAVDGASKALDSQTSVLQTLPFSIEINWDLLLEQRPAIMAHTDLPSYLLMPEIHQLLDASCKDNLRLMIDVLWHTGLRISECLALRPDSFAFDSTQPYVSVTSLKSRGRPRKGDKTRRRLVPIADLAFLKRLRRYIESHQIKKQARLFPITRNAAYKRITRLAMALQEPLSIEISPHTFRHSFAVHAILHATPLPVLQGWMGHATIDSTLIYTQVLSLETHHFIKRIPF